MEEAAQEVLYETRHHASRSYTSNYPPQQTNEGAKGSFLSLLSARGVAHLKEKWSEYRCPRKIKKWTSLFVSPRGERVAVASGNQITILQKDDDYCEPCGIFSSCSHGTYTYGTWSESHDVLGLVDDTDTLYFIKTNGEEITRITKRNLKVTSPIIGLIAQDGSDVQEACLCSFNVLTSDGSLHRIEISQEPSASLSSTLTSNNGLNKQQHFPQDVFCFDYHPELCLLVVVGSNVSFSPTSSGNFGACNLSLWRKTMTLDLESVFSTQFRGLYSKSKGYVGQLAYPKVLISPQGKFIATLDITGCLEIFKMDKEYSSFSSFACGQRCDSQATVNLSNGVGKSLTDIVDFTWWSDYILTLAKRSGIVTMLDIRSGAKLLQNDPVYFLPVLERVQQFQGHLFLLESTSEESHNSTTNRETSDLHHVELVTEDRFNHLDIARLRWSLISYSARSVPEMYNILIDNQKYQAALDFANRHALDKDEVLKSQWLQSDQGINEIYMFLSNIKDQMFVLSECVDKVGQTEDAVKALLAYGLRLTDLYKFSETENHEGDQIWDFRMTRLQLLQFRDRLETYLGINMGRFSEQDYRKFRVMPINEAAVTLAESGKIGALNLLFKRHPYSLSPSMLAILAAIPETVPVQSYGQLLPGRSPPISIAIRERDWVECEKMVSFINRLPENHEISSLIRTEPFVKQCLGFFWPSIDQLSVWYKNRARDIDSFSGQLDNCLCLVDFACRKGIHELQQFYEDISYLHQLIYFSDSDGETNFALSLVAWEQLSDFEKFKVMLRGVKEENVVESLREKAIPFMQSRFHTMTSDPKDGGRTNHLPVGHKIDESFLIKWMKEIAMENKLNICLLVIEEGCREFKGIGIFRDEVEATECALQCLYLCPVTDKWNIMAAILSKLPQMQEYLDSTDTVICLEGLEKRLKLAEGHIEAGRLLAYYQVPKPMSFFLEAHSDEKGVKQVLRLILSKFIRRQPGRSDNDWANMWRDMQCLQEKAFPFLDLEYMLIEFCRGLLKAGKFPLARNYLKGTGSVALASEKAESLVIQAAREYFFSASSLACSEIWKAKECLGLFPSSRNVKAEADIIDALTVRLPNLGVTLLPMEFRQVKDPMEIIKMAITSQAGAYLHVDELIQIAKLLGLSSQDDISAVEEAIAREAAVAGDLHLAFDLCLVLAKKGHGLIWDLCAAIARGPALENIDISSRKQLLGFALSHCDEESIGELLHAWKDLDMQGQCETLMMLTGSNPPNFRVQNSSIRSPSFQNIHNTVNIRDFSGLIDGFGSDDQDAHFNNLKNLLSDVATNLPVENGTNWESLLSENGKILPFASLQLPWLLELSRRAGQAKKLFPGKQFVNVRTRAVLTILSWLARNGFSPRDSLVASLAKSIIEPPVTEEDDIMGCSFLLNLVDAFNGVGVIEEQLRIRQSYQDICSIMNMGMTYSLLHNSGVECEGPAQRRDLLLRKFNEKHSSFSSDEINNIDSVQSTFWRDWKLKLEEQKRVADHSRVLEQIIPGVEIARFLSGDFNYIESVVFSLVESVKLEKKCVLKDALKLADTYGLNHTEVLQRYLSSILVSEVWTDDAINTEISVLKRDLLACAVDTIKTISLRVYPEINGCNKQRLAYIYGLLSECYLQLEGTQEIFSVVPTDPAVTSTIGLAHFYKVIEQECRRVSFIKFLNFKNVAGLGSLNFMHFSGEVYNHIDEVSLEALAKMVQNLVSIYTDSVPEGLISWQDVYKHYVVSLLTTLESKVKTKNDIENHETLLSLINQLEQTYDLCRMYIKVMAHSDALDIMKRYFMAIVPLSGFTANLPDTSTWQDCLIVLLNFWIRLTEDMQEIASHESASKHLKYTLECLLMCLKVFLRLIIEDTVSPSQGWGTIIGYVNYGLVGNFAVEIFIFCKLMVFSGCGFSAIAEVYSETVALCATLTDDTEVKCESIQDLPRLYLNILEPILQTLISESHEHQNLYCLLSSLSKLEGDLEDLKRVRHAVWERMAEFSGNLQLPSHIRVYALELMQYITGRNIKCVPAELQSNVLPWEGWDELHCTGKNSELTANRGVQNHTDTSNRFTSTLVALRSSQLVAVISPSIEVTPDDLLNVETAVSCFSKLCKAATTETHFDALLAILGEWEGLFLTGRDEEASVEASDAENNWNIDDWDEGWESFQEEESVEKEKKNQLSSLSVHPLHECWMEVFKKIIKTPRSRDVLKQIDKSFAKSNGILLDEDSARGLTEIILGIDCFMALKMVLLLPYEAIQVQCLDAVEDKLKQEGISDTIGKDYEVLLLVLSSGVTSTIIAKSCYGTIFSYLCYMVGNLSRQCQETLSRQLKQYEGDLLLFNRIMFPCFISELVKVDQHILAGFLVTKFMHMVNSLSLINVAEASLSTYLERQLRVLQDDKFSLEETGLCEILGNTVSSLRGKLGNLIRSALSSLSTNLR